MVAGRARAVVIGVGSNTAMGSIRDSMLMTEDVSFKLLTHTNNTLYFAATVICCFVGAGGDTIEEKVG